MKRLQGRLLQERIGGEDVGSCTGAEEALAWMARVKVRRTFSHKVGDNLISRFIRKRLEEGC